VRALGPRLRVVGWKVRASIVNRPAIALTAAGVATFLAVLGVALVVRWLLRPPPVEEGAPPIVARAVPEAPVPFPARAGTLEELRGLHARGRSLLEGTPMEAGLTPLLAAALLASEYGVAPPASAMAWADKLRTSRCRRWAGRS
jgi:hypothetical protein